MSKNNTVRQRQIKWPPICRRSFQMCFLERTFVTSIQISLKFVPKDSINNSPTLVQIMAWRREWVICQRLDQWWPSSLTRVSVTRPRWDDRHEYVHQFRIRHKSIRTHVHSTAALSGQKPILVRSSYKRQHKIYVSLWEIPSVSNTMKVKPLRSVIKQQKASFFK